MHATGGTSDAYLAIAAATLLEPPPHPETPAKGWQYFDDLYTRCEILITLAAHMCVAASLPLDLVSRIHSTCASSAEVPAPRPRISYIHSIHAP